MNSLQTSPSLLMKDRRVLVLGLGISGLAMTRWCAEHGAMVHVIDTRAQPPMLGRLQAECPQAQFKQSDFAPSLLEEGHFDAVYRSPGLSPALVGDLWMAAHQKGLECGGELNLFWSALQHLKVDQSYAPALLAITGTNGKTTVTSLTGQLVERAGKSVAVAGNIGPSLLDTLSDAIQAQKLPQVWVLELSSFQLADIDNFDPAAAVVLNVTQDHLDWHTDMADYASAKAHIFGASTTRILYRDDSVVNAMRPSLTKGQVTPQVITFGQTMPERPGDYGIESVNGMTWLVRALEADETRKRRKDEETELHIQRLMPADALRIRGRHNATNALAALALAHAAGCALGPMLYGLREYRGEPHRVEHVAIVNDVEYVDDSKGTNVGATVAALNGLGADRKLVVILGGDGKGQDFSPLRNALIETARAVVLIGRDAPLIEKALQGLTLRIQHASDMADAVSACAQLAQAGDAVLLSPACASLDMYKDYAHRADAFRAAVDELMNAHGADAVRDEA